MLAGALGLSAGLLPHAREVNAAPDPDAWEAPPPLDWPATNPIIESEEVGYLPGGGAISSAGDYTYTMPIAVPDGRAGMQPRVSLQYSSRAGNGLLGKGWSLDYGGSEIQRCAKTVAVDGETEGVRYDLYGALCLDGQRLLHVAGPSQMVEGAEYRTERDTFAKIVAHGDSGLGPDSFEVFEKGGNIRIYRPLEAKRVTEPDVAENPEVTPLSARRRQCALSGCFERSAIVTGT